MLILNLLIPLAIAINEPLPSLNAPLSVQGSFSLTGFSGGLEFPLGETQAKELFKGVLGEKLLSLKPELYIGGEIAETKAWEAYIAFKIKTFYKGNSGISLKNFVLYNKEKTLSYLPVAYIFLKSPYSPTKKSLLLVFGGAKGKKIPFNKSQDFKVEEAFDLFKSSDNLFGGFVYYPDFVSSPISITLTGNAKMINIAIGTGY